MAISATGRINETIDVLDFELDEGDMRSLNRMQECDEKMCWNPDGVP
jgi:hypothetical protein